MNDFRVLLQAVLDKSGINTELKEVQDIINKYSVEIMPELKTASLRNQMKTISKDIANDFNKTFGTNLTGNDVFRAYENQAKSVIEQNKLVDKSFTELRKNTYQSIGDKSPELKQMAEMYKQEAIEAEKIATERNKLVEKSFTDLRKNEYQSVGDKSPELQKMAEMYKQEAVEAEKVATAANKINQSISSGTNEAKVEKLTASFRSLGLSTEETQKELSGVNAALKSLGESSDGKSLINNAETLKAEYGKVENQIRQMEAAQKGFASESQRLSKINSIKTWADNNSKAMKEFGGRIDGIITKMSTIDLPDTEFKKLNAEFEKIQLSARDMGLLGKTWGDSFKEGVSKFGSWIFASGGVMTAINGLRKMKDASIELNGAITNLAMATGASKGEIQSLISTYSQLGDQLSSNVIDVTKSATEWLKQGKSIADTNELIRDSMILSKVGNLSSEDSTKYLTSAMKGYKVAVEDTLNVVDKLSAVDMASATDVGGLAEGMSEVAASADLAGISMDKLLGYLAVIGETTQDSMSSVGTSLNAIFSRMGNIKLSRLKDYQNSGEDLSNVETVLSGEGINLRDSQNSFRNFGDVLDEVAGKWDSFSEVSQHAIASAFAGTEHINDFIILMQQYGTAMKYTETSLDSSGKAMKKFSVYQDSTSAHTEKFKNAFIDLSDSVVNSSLLKFFIDFGTIGVKSINAITGALGGLGSISAIGGGILGAKGLGQRNCCRYNRLRGSRKSLLLWLKAVGKIGTSLCLAA